MFHRGEIRRLQAATFIASLIIFGLPWLWQNFGRVITVRASSLLHRTASGKPGASVNPPSPLIYLWAWERREDLTFLNPAKAGVAFLARSVYLVDGEVYVRPRQQPLRVAPGTALMAVVRIETIHERPARLTPSQRRAAVDAIATVAQLPGISAVQVDFDALASQRDFYRALLTDLRAAIPRNIPLSITALASWCYGDNWLAGLPIDEAVPMLFRMGPGRHQVLSQLSKGVDFRAPVCRTSLGISTDERLPQLPSGRRMYVFSPRAWTSSSAAEAEGYVRLFQ